MRTVKSILNIISTILVVILVILAILLAGVRVFGLTPYTVLSGSMEPNYHVGSLVYVKKTDAPDLKEGDAITYMADEKTIVTHRIAQIVPDEEDASVLRFITKGDANDKRDAAPVHQNNVIGKVLFTVPYLGYVSEYIRHAPGMYVAIGACLALLILTFLPGLIADEATKKKDEKEKPNGPEGPENNK